MSQLAILIAIYCVKGGQSPCAEILQKCPYHFSLVSSHFLHVQAVQQPCKWGKDKSATCGEGQPWMADLSCRSLWGVAISYSLCFIIITKAEAISAAFDAMNICARSFKTIFITKCCSGSSYPGSVYYHHDLSNHLQIYCVSRLLEKCGKVILGVAVDIKTVCHNWKFFLLEHQFYVFTFVCGIGSWVYFWHGISWATLVST